MGKTSELFVWATWSREVLDCIRPLAMNRKSLARLPADVLVRFWLPLMVLGLLAAAGLSLGQTHPVRAAAQPIRVALMDFSVDDNSYQSAQRAADFTSLLQLQMAHEPGLEWVERVQLHLARQELGLSEMDFLSGSSSIRRGKWAKADWLITGQFSLDDQNRRTLFVEITDLHHADVLASQTVNLSGGAGASIETGPSQLQVVVTALPQSIAQARQRAEQNSGKVLLAPLFFADIGGFGPPRDSQPIQRGFYEALERVALTNSQLRLIRFPKAYQSMDEAEMVLDGLVEADHEAWEQIADLYVWGTYSNTNMHGAGKYQSMHKLSFHIWDGVSQPLLLEQEYPHSGFESVSMSEGVLLLARFQKELSARAHPRPRQPGSAEIRRQVAGSMLQTFRRMSGPHEQLGLHDRAGFIEAVHLVETACFFDPDNAHAQVLRITCRWGWWMDFGFTVKNQFWSRWRRSRAWGKYVEHFGLQPVSVPLPFPYDRNGIAGIYVESLAELVRRFPERIETEEEAKGQWSRTKEAQAHGFPREMPPPVIAQWKTQLEAELRERNRKVQQYSNSFARVTNTIPTAASSNRPSAQANQSHTLPQRPSTPPGKNPSPTVSSPVSPRYVPPPAWFKDLRLRMTASRMFQLYAPSVLPVEVTPPMKAVAFPPHFDVNSISRMGLWNDQLLILAIDERSAPSNDPTPDIMAELLSKSGRLWTLAPDGESAVLFEEKLLPDNLNSFLVQNDRLWIAGHSAGYFDLQHLDFHHCRMNDGSDPPEFQAFTVGGGRLFAVGSFKVYSLDPISSQWTNLPQPFGTFSAGTGIPCLLTANNHWLCYPSASASLYNISKGGWTNLPSLSLHCAIADDEFFWFGGPSGLHRYNPASATLQSWPPASGVQGMSNPAMGEPYAMASQIPAASLEWVADRLVSFFKKLQKERARTHEDKNAPRDPLQLAWRIPGEISAVAKDGDFLWLGSNQRLLLLHTPSLSLVGYCKIDGQVSSLVASPDSVWVGTACGQQLLSRIRKQDFLSVPKGQWTPLAISPEERKAIISRWALRDQAMYAFYAGDDARVAELLGHLDPRKATLEEMFLLAFAYDALGVDKPEPCRDWHGRIASRYPDSPWAKIARDALEENEQNHKARQHQQSLLAKYDRNHDGALDQSERLAMEKDPAYQREAKLFNNEQLETQLREIMKKYDRDGNGKLDRDELENLRNSVLIFSQASPALLSGRKIIVAPLLTEKFPAVVTLLKKYDANHDGALNESELKALAHDLKK